MAPAEQVEPGGLSEIRGPLRWSQTVWRGDVGGGDLMQRVVQHVWGRGGMAPGTAGLVRGEVGFGVEVMEDELGEFCGEGGGHLMSGWIWW